MQVEFVINRQPVALEVDPRETLLSVLRERLELRGTKYGCGEGECGACTVILNGRPVNACLIPMGQVHGAEVLTVEAMTADAVGQHVVDAFVECGAVQCGFCTPGLVLSSRALLVENPTPTDAEVKDALAGNLCRCTGYAKIVQAVHTAATRISDGPSRPHLRQTVAPGFQTREYVRPGTLQDALELLARSEDWRVVSGGTDVGVKYENHLRQYRWLDLTGLEELQAIDEDGDALFIGAGARYSALLESATVRRWAQPLARAAAMVGGTQIQNVGTLGGNLVNASPAADAVPPLFVLGALAVLQSVRGARRLSVTEVATGPGATALAPDELLTHVVVPKRRQEGSEIAFFDKLGPRKAQTIAIASVALRGWLAGDRMTNVRIALGAVAPTVMLAPQAAGHLMDGALTAERVLEAGEIAAQACGPIDDVRGSAAYRRQLVRGLLVRNLWPHLAQL